MKNRTARLVNVHETVEYQTSQNRAGKRTISFQTGTIATLIFPGGAFERLRVTSTEICVIAADIAGVWATSIRIGSGRMVWRELTEMLRDKYLSSC